jgi:hypothetical protein
MILYRMVMGDPSDDGHGKHSEFIVRSDSTIEDMHYLFKCACKQLDIPDIEDQIQEYESSSLDQITTDKIKELFPDIEIDYAWKYKLGYYTKYNDPDNPYEESTMFSLNPDTYALLIVKVINKVYLHLNLQLLEIPSHRVGGYGLYN